MPADRPPRGDVCVEARGREAWGGVVLRPGLAALLAALLIADVAQGKPTYKLELRLHVNFRDEDITGGGGGGAEGAPGAHGTEGVSLDFSFWPQDDPMPLVVQECERRGLGQAACEEVMYEVGERFQDYLQSSAGRIASMDPSETIQALFRMKQAYDSTGLLLLEGRELDQFEDVRSWWKFQEMMGEALIPLSDLDRFSRDPIFHFTCPEWTWGDSEAAALAAQNSAEDKEALFRTGDSHVGYLDGDLPNHLNGVLPTTNTCRHTMHFTALMRVLMGEQSGVSLSEMTFVEIGGGYGNLARLIVHTYGFASWTILDLPFMGRLQRFYLNKTTNSRVLVNASPRELHDALHTDSSEQDGDTCVDGVCEKPRHVNLVDTNNLNTWFSKGFTGADVLVATSSLSELDMDDFYWYLNHVIPRVKYFLYAYSKGWPSADMQIEKLRLISSMCSLAYSHESAKGQTVTSVFVRR